MQRKRKNLSKLRLIVDRVMYFQKQLKEVTQIQALLIKISIFGRNLSMTFDIQITDYEINIMYKRIHSNIFYLTNPVVDSSNKSKNFMR